MIAVLALLTALCAGAGLRDLDRHAAGRKALFHAARDERRRTAGGGAGPADLPLPPWLARPVRIFQPLGLALAGEEARRAIRRQLLAAGRPQGFDVAAFVGLRLSTTVLGLLLGAYLESLPLTGLMAIAGWMAPGQWLQGKVSERQSQIRSDLPDFLDAVAISLAAGAPVETALQDVTERFDGPIRQEMEDVLAQIALGVPRQQAFRQVLERNPSRELESVVLALVHGMQLGVPLSEALALQARAMRNTRAQRARQLAGQAAPRITLVSTLFVTPSVLFLIIGLLVLNFYFNKNLFGFQDLMGSF